VTDRPGRAASLADVAALESAIAGERRRAEALGRRQAVLEEEIAAARAERTSLSAAIPSEGSKGDACGAILVYHRVSVVGSEPGGPSVTPADFRAHMAHLAQRYRPLSLEAMVRGLEAGSLPARAVAVTLDDGYLDALEAASPILVDLGVPATFFCLTARLEDEHEMWWDTLDRVLLDGPPAADSITLTLAGRPRAFATATPEARREAVAAIAEALRAAALDERDRALAEIARWPGTRLAPRATHRVLTGAEIERLARRPGHSVGAHSANHLALPLQTPDVRAREIVACRRRLERRLEREVTALAYPYGAYDEATVEAVRAAGFEAALTVEEGLCRTGDDALRLPRVEVRSSGVEAFAARLGRLFASARSRALET
jgi:peptidoglycan/xylan/chitin deacetylase (PgdA/CDA1 family)